MPTIKPRCTITFEDEALRDRIDTFRFENRYRSQNKVPFYAIFRHLPKMKKSRNLNDFGTFLVWVERFELSAS